MSISLIGRALLGAVAVMIAPATTQLAAQVSRTPAARAMATAAVRSFQDSLDLPRPIRPRVWGQNIGGDLLYMYPTLGAAHAVVMRQLDSAAALDSSEVWILTARVQFRVFGGAYASAERLVARNCAVLPDWWCAALTGYTRHLQRRFPEAERDFDRALTLLPETMRCEWTDLSLIMTDSGQAQRYRRLGCAGREQTNARMWWLGDPLYSVPGNDRKTEHYSRWVVIELARMETDALYQQTVPTAQLLGPMNSAARWGTPLFCLKSTGRPEDRAVVAGVKSTHTPGLEGDVSVTRQCAHSVGVGAPRDYGGEAGLPPGLTYTYSNLTNSFLPSEIAVKAPFAVRISDDRLAPGAPGGRNTYTEGTPIAGPPPMAGPKNPPADRNRATADSLDLKPIPSLKRSVAAVIIQKSIPEQYGIPDGRVARIADAQVAYFPRSDSTALALSAFDPRVDYRFLNADLSVALAVTRSPTDSIRTITTTLGAQGPARLALLAPRDSAIMSLEVVRPARGAARARFGVVPTMRDARERVEGSDLLLYDASSGVIPRAVNEAQAVMLPTTTLARSTPVGLFWELRGVQVGDAPHFALKVDRATGSVWSAITQAVSLRGNGGAVSLSWTPTPLGANDIGSAAEAGYALIADLRALRPGRYRLRLTATVANALPVTIERFVEIR